MNKIMSLNQAQSHQDVNHREVQSMFDRINRAIKLSTCMPISVDLHAAPLHWANYRHLRSLADNQLPFELKGTGFDWSIDGEQVDQSGKYVSNYPMENVNHMYFLRLRLRAPIQKEST